jgi:hypothetical protein
MTTPRLGRTLRPAGLALLLALLPVVACLRPTTASESLLAAPPDDAMLFAAVVRSLQREPSFELRVDPRPLRVDPRLVTLRSFNVMPDRVDPDAQLNPLADGASGVLAARATFLRSVDLATTDALVDSRCPGVMLPVLPGSNPWRDNGCPSSGSYRSVLIATPRAGPAYWPGNVDHRAQFAGRHVYTVRVIERDMTPRGSVEESSDYVFERDARQRWVAIERVRLLLVE